MIELTEAQVRHALKNCSAGERRSAHLPKLQDLPWAELDYLGWRDPKAPQRGYLVLAREDVVRGIVVRAPASPVRRTAQCLLCLTVRQGGISLFVAARGGTAGRNGNTTGTYICDDLGCSAHLRAALRPSRTLPDPAPVIAARAHDLVRRVDGFISSVLAA